MKSIQEAIDEKMQKAADDITVIRALPAYAFEAEQVYLSSLDLAKAVSEAHRLSEMAERKAAYEAEKAKHQAAEVKPESVAEVLEKPKKHCLDFRVWLTVEQAKELKAFFQSRNIEFEKI